MKEFEKWFKALSEKHATACVAMGFLTEKNKDVAVTALSSYKNRYLKGWVSALEWALGEEEWMSPGWAISPHKLKDELEE